MNYLSELALATSELQKATGIREQRGGPYQHPHKHGHGTESIKYHHHGKYGKHPASQHHTVGWDNKYQERPSSEHYHTHDEYGRHSVGRQHITHLGITHDYHQHGAYSAHPVTRHHVHE